LLKAYPNPNPYNVAVSAKVVSKAVIALEELVTIASLEAYVE
jgi:hypothetical protein